MYGTVASSEKRRTLLEVGTMIYCIPDPHNPRTKSIDEPIYNFCRSTFYLETQSLVIHCLGILGLGMDSACFLFMCRASKIPFFVRGKIVHSYGERR